MKKLNVAIIGYNFMGKAHSNAWLNAKHFFSLPAEPVLKVAVGRHIEPLTAFADNWGWEEVATDWREVVARPDVDIVDVSTPTVLHYEIALAAAKAGKHIFLEKPFALNVAQSEEMVAAAQKAGVVNYVNHNYRRAPAVQLARQLIDDGKIGRIFHWRGAYLQDWIVDPDFSLTWQLQKEQAGAGPQWDLNSHSVDLARFLVGDISSVVAMATTFIKERPLPSSVTATAFKGGEVSQEKGPVTVDDAAFMVAQFANGALGAFEASRFASGRKNFNYFEIYGDKGSLAFNLERMNELQFFSREDPANAQGFRTILATESVHPYVGAWWPPGHIIGYEHEFSHAVVDFVNTVVNGGAIHPDFYDGLQVIKVLEAGLESARTGQKVEIK